MDRDLRVYRPVPPEGFEWALPIHDADFETFQTLGAQPRGGAWSPPEMELLRVDDRGGTRKRADMPWLGSHVLVLRDEAIESVGRLIAPYGEILPLRVNDARLSVFSARLLPGALDEERSELVRFGSGQIMDLKRPVFHDEIVDGVGAFKLPEMPRGDIYLTEEMVMAIRSTGQSAGTEFVLVYESGSAVR